MHVAFHGGAASAVAAGGLESLVPRYPRRRGRRITPRVIELVGQARASLHSAAAAPAERQGENAAMAKRRATYEAIVRIARRYPGVYATSCWIAHVKNCMACRFGKRGIAPPGWQSPCPVELQPMIKKALRDLGAI